ncbi:MAG: glycosyltransferase family 4 protein [Bryobacteraceae bacterium]
MKVVVATSISPFIDGGATQIASWLTQALREAGHEVDFFQLPFSPLYSEVLDQTLAFRLIDLSDRGERLIAIRTPSHLLRHPFKILWFIHHHRTAYDLWGTRYQDFPNTPEGICYRDAIRRADAAAFGEARRIFCNSGVMAARIKKFNGVDAEVLYPPLLRPEVFRQDNCGDYILYVSRLTHHKRQWLAIQGMLHTKTQVRLIIAGQPDPDSRVYLRELETLAQSKELGGRVSIIPRWIPEQEKIDLLANCLASIYIPLDEDSYGYPSLEAHHAGKAVITATDSGGTLELIRDRENGFVVPPDPEAIGRAMDELYRDRNLARTMGERGRRRIGELGISNEKMLQKLLS